MSIVLTGPLCRAARALVQWPRTRLAEACGVSADIIAAFENANADPGAPAKAAIIRVLEEGGAVFIPEDDQGPGVRLKFRRSDVKAIDRMEGEGGPVGSDDV